MKVIDGLTQDSIAVTEPTELVGTVQGAVRVLAGELVVSGTIQGSLVVENANVRVSPSGRVQGSLHVATGSRVEVQGQLAGSVHNFGTLIRQDGSTHAGPIFGDGNVTTEQGATIVQPRIEADGSHHYDL